MAEVEIFLTVVLTHIMLEYLVKVIKLGGNIIMPKTAVSGWGYIGICVDTENNTFGLWEEDRNVK